jgi:hypothetical protein
VTDNEENLKKPKYVGEETPESYLKRVSQLPPMETAPFHVEFNSYVDQYVAQVRARIDEVCARALLGGKYGVKVTTYLGDGSIQIEVSEDVPFGEIHYRSEDRGIWHYG